MIEKEKFWLNKKVLITGFSGFLGSHLTLELLTEKADVVGVDINIKRPMSIINYRHPRLYPVCADVKNFNKISGIISKFKPEFIFHLAAQAIVGEANKNPRKTFKDNIEGTWNILEVARRAEAVKNIIIASSDKAYGVANKLPYREESRLCGIYPYDVSKSCADLISLAYFKSFFSPVCVVRCGNIYGPADFHFNRIVPDAIRSALSGKTLLIRSDGKFTRDYIYVGDVVAGYLKLAREMKKKKIYGEAFNFSNEIPVNVLDLVKKIYLLTGKKPNYRILNQAKCEIKDQYLSSSKARRVLNWKPKESLNTGLMKTIDWYRRYFKNL